MAKADSVRVQNKLFGFVAGLTEMETPQIMGSRQEDYEET